MTKTERKYIGAQQFLNTMETVIKLLNRVIPS